MKSAGQRPFAAGSRIATHSTCDVIETMSQDARPCIVPGQQRFPPSRRGLADARSVKWASSPAGAALPRAHADKSASSGASRSAFTPPVSPGRSTSAKSCSGTAATDSCTTAVPCPVIARTSWGSRTLVSQLRIPVPFLNTTPRSCYNRPRVCAGINSASMGPVCGRPPPGCRAPPPSAPRAERGRRVRYKHHVAPVSAASEASITWGTQFALVADRRFTPPPQDPHFVAAGDGACPLRGL